jgi:AhpD family alkylhydroperoxidase
MRIEPVAPGTRLELAAQERQILAERGRIPPLYQVLLNSPPLAHGWEQMLSAVRNRNSVSADLRELVILRVAILNRAPYEFEAHVPHALAAGLDDAQVAAVREADAAQAGCFDAKQAVALRLADAMTRAIEVPAALFEEVRACFDRQQQVDLVGTIAAYNMVSRFLVAFEIGH